MNSTPHAPLRSDRPLPAFASLALLIGLMVASLAVPIPWLPHPLSLLAAMGLYGLLAWRVPVLRPPAGSLRLGRPAFGWVAAFAVLSALGLAGWYFLARPNLDDLAPMLPDLPLVVLALGGVVFSVLNALAEELAFRGLLQPQLEGLTGRPSVAVLVQGALFGLAHIHGFPRGLVGVLLAGGYGIALGLLRRHTDGLLGPLLAHIAADLTIVTLVFVYFGLA